MKWEAWYTLICASALQFPTGIRVKISGCAERQLSGQDAVHLNGQNGIRYDQDKAFGVENLRAAFNQVKVLKGNHAGVCG